MATILSPLRYPGAKRRLAPYIAELLRVNDLRPALFVEPFAGGASVSLQLLNDARVDQIGLVERDALVASFWRVLFSPDPADVSWLVEQVRTVEVSLEKWHSYRKGLPEGERERALACLFLNRTSFSGILAPGAGPIGGQAQRSQYKIDCRFPRETLVRRIEQAAAMHERVAFVWEGDWEQAVVRIIADQVEGSVPQNVCFYFDPPFFEKANRLYTHYFEEDDHRRLRDVLRELRLPWILSYDDRERVEELYRLRQAPQVELLYSASQNGGSRPAKEVVLTNQAKLPAHTRLWQSTKERRKA